MERGACGPGSVHAHTNTLHTRALLYMYIIIGETSGRDKGAVPAEGSAAVAVRWQMKYS